MVTRVSTLPAQQPEPSRPTTTAAAVVSAARALVRATPSFWAEESAWRSPNPAIAGNAEPGKTQLGARNTAKCNLFIFDAMFAAGVQLATSKGSYPLAFEFAKAAGQGSRFEAVATAELHDPASKQVVVVRPFRPGGWQADAKKRMGEFRASIEKNWASLEPEHRARRESLEAAFRAAKPGDVIVEKHRFKNGAGDSHMYLVLKNTYEQTGTLEAAQASDSGGEIVQVSPKFMTVHEAVYVIRPKLN